MAECRPVLLYTVLLFAIVLPSWISAERCNSDGTPYNAFNLFNRLDDTFTCPRPGDSRDATSCCFESSLYDSHRASCCNHWRVFAIIGGVIGALILIVGVVIVSCLCCAICPLAKKRRTSSSRIRTVTATPGAMQAAVVTPAPGPGGYPVQQQTYPGPPQGAPYPVAEAQFPTTVATCPVAGAQFSATGAPYPSAPLETKPEHVAAPNPHAGYPTGQPYATQQPNMSTPGTAPVPTAAVAMGCMPPSYDDATRMG